MSVTTIITRTKSATTANNVELAGEAMDYRVTFRVEPTAVSGVAFTAETWDGKKYAIATVNADGEFTMCEGLPKSLGIIRKLSNGQKRALVYNLKLNG